MVTQDKCFEPLKRNERKWTWNTEILLRNPKQLRFQMCTENKICYIYNLDIRNNKTKGNYFLKKKIFLENFSVSGPFLLVSLQGLKTFVLGDHLPHSEKKLEYKQKSYIFCLFLPNYYLAIASGARNLVASER